MVVVPVAEHGPVLEHAVGAFDPVADVPAPGPVGFTEALVLPEGELLGAEEAAAHGAAALPGSSVGADDGLTGAGHAVLAAASVPSWWMPP